MVVVVMWRQETVFVRHCLISLFQILLFKMESATIKKSLLFSKTESTSKTESNIIFCMIALYWHQRRCHHEKLNELQLLWPWLSNMQARIRVTRLASTTWPSTRGRRGWGRASSIVNSMMPTIVISAICTGGNLTAHFTYSVNIWPKYTLHISIAKSVAV